MARTTNVKSKRLLSERRAAFAALVTDKNTTKPFLSARDTPPVEPKSRTNLPLVAIPSKFLPERFLAASSARGARPERLKLVDSHLSMLERAVSPRERFERLQALQKVLDDFVHHYTRQNTRRQAATQLKKWVDGAIHLREDVFHQDGEE